MRAVFGLVAVLGVAQAAPAPTAPQTALDQLADQIAVRAVAAVPWARSADVGICISGAPAEAVRALGPLLVGRLRGRVASAVENCEARGLEARLQIELVLGTSAVARGEVIAVASGLWGGSDDVRARLFAETPLDGDLRAMLPSPTKPTIIAVAPQSGGPGVMAAPDLDALAMAVSGRSLWVLTPRELVELSVEAGRVAERRRLRLAGALSPSPPRAMLGTLLATSDGIRAHSGVFADGIRIAAGKSEPARGWPLAGFDGSCELAAQGDGFAAERCMGMANLPERFVAAAQMTRPDGTRVVAAVLPGTTAALPTLTVRVGQGSAWEVRGSGVAVAVGGLKLGEVVAHSAPTLPGERDSVTLRGVSSGLPVVGRLDKITGAVRALAIGDLDGDGVAELWVWSRDTTGRCELWRVDH
jgi:hypothetical protein